MDTTPHPKPTPVHVFVLLDRSGSMEAIRSDVIGGFNQFLAKTQADGVQTDDGRPLGKARLTLVQFDTQDPHEVVFAGRDVAKVPPLTEATFVPRAATPLYDATGCFIARIDRRVAKRKAAGKRPEKIVVVTITDGQENSSVRWSRSMILDLIEARRAAGWTFVYLSADPSAYADATVIGYDPRSVQQWAPDETGAQLAFTSLGSGLAALRYALADHRDVDPGDFFAGDKPAEADRRRRYGT